MDSAVIDKDLIDLLFAPPHGAKDRGADGASPAWRNLPDPCRLGRRMAALYAVWQRRRLPDMTALAGMLLRRTGIGPGDPLIRCCLGAARAVDAWGGFPYHSAAHHAEVATNAMVLAELADRLGHRLDKRAAAMLLAASLAHDLHYLPAAGRPRFAAEGAAADAMDAIAAEAGCTDADRATLRALIIATEPGLRLRPGGPLGAPLDPAAMGRFDALPASPDVAALAAILSDADLLSSVGLTPGWYQVQKTRLEAESGQMQRPVDSTRFFRDIVGPDFLSEPGRVFSANLAAIRHGACAAS